MIERRRTGIPAHIDVCSDAINTHRPHWFGLVEGVSNPAEADDAHRSVLGSVLAHRIELGLSLYWAAEGLQLLRRLPAEVAGDVGEEVGFAVDVEADLAVFVDGGDDRVRHGLSGDEVEV